MIDGKYHLGQMYIFDHKILTLQLYCKHINHFKRMSLKLMANNLPKFAIETIHNFL